LYRGANGVIEEWTIPYDPESMLDLLNIYIHRRYL